MCVFSQEYNKNSIYIVGRGTLSKKEFIGDRFNLYNSNLTHIGIGLVEGDSLNVFNVSPDKKFNDSNLVKESISDFKDVIDIFYFKIWEFKTDSVAIQKLSYVIKNYQKYPIIFDKLFNVEDDNKMYCSEFVYKVLNNLEIFDFKTVNIQLNGMEKDILNKDVLEYFPVDLFLYDSLFVEKF